jgi:flagellar hook-length control protein FliK
MGVPAPTGGVLKGGEFLSQLASALIAKVADGKKQPASGLLTQPAQGRPPGEPAETAALSEKTESRKKPVRGTAAGAHLAAHAAHRSDAPPQGPSQSPAPKQDSTAEQARTALSVPNAAASHRADPALHVVDLRRTRAGATSDSAAAPFVLGTAAATEKEAASAVAVKASAAREISPGSVGKPASPSPAPDQTPVERLREMAGSEMLRAANLILKDGGGEIRLTLKPDSLGSVRIRMNVVDNAIEGRIIVDSSAAKAVVDGSIDALRRALTAEGFQTASLQVSVGGQNADSGSRQEEQPPEAVRRLTAQGFERNVPGAEIVGLGDQLVNLFV